MTAEEVTARLEAQKTGPGRWIARCPAHEDRDPSLSVTLTPDGTILLYCWAGCDTGRVLEAAGLAWRDLFPPGSRPARPVAAGTRPRRSRPRSRLEEWIRRFRENPMLKFESGIGCPMDIRWVEFQLDPVTPEQVAETARDLKARRTS